MEKTKEQRDHANELITFTVECTMKRRWAEQFLGMLNHMRRLGSMSSSRTVKFFADGDGDYRPKFNYIAPCAPSNCACGVCAMIPGKRRRVLRRRLRQQRRPERWQSRANNV